MMLCRSENTHIHALGSCLHVLLSNSQAATRKGNAVCKQVRLDRCMTHTWPLDRCCAYHSEATARSEGGYCKQSVVAWPAKVSHAKKVSAASGSTRLSALCSLLYLRANEKGSPLRKSKAKAYSSARSASNTRSCSTSMPLTNDCRPLLLNMLVSLKYKSLGPAGSTPAEVFHGDAVELRVNCQLIHCR